ncbi:hypothetical protein [uncultured Deefgea sp.]|uniref:hypothetical protein n=1 Tax=uncultured Deefgea sp. TaxID=1304914 RepID=UPI0025922540|nr:hypothetical protein [uncultured Deefgea sp.]
MRFSFKVLSPINYGIAVDGRFVEARFEIGSIIELPEEDAAPLIACNAIEFNPQSDAPTEASVIEAPKNDSSAGTDQADQAAAVDDAKKAGTKEAAK